MRYMSANWLTTTSNSHPPKEERPHRLVTMLFGSIRERSSKRSMAVSGHGSGGPNPRRQALADVTGLLGEAERMSGWTLAEQAGDPFSLDPPLDEPRGIVPVMRKAL
jgi:hypothetical protein